MSSKITVNGQTYESVEQMPPDARRAYEQAMSMLADRNGNGVPDILEGEGGNTTINTSSGKPIVTKVVTSSRFVVNGHQFDRWEDIPPQMKTMLSNASVQPGSRAVPGRTLTPEPGGITIRITTSTVLAM